jgi:hypothetical protein
MEWKKKIYNSSSNILSAIVFFLHASQLHIFNSDYHIYVMEAVLNYRHVQELRVIEKNQSQLASSPFISLSAHIYTLSDKIYRIYC